MKLKNKGISLIVLIITIIVMIVIAGAIILNLNDSNIIEQARDAVNDNNIKTIEQLANKSLAELLLDPANKNLSDEEIAQKIKEDIGEKNYNISYNKQTGKITVTNIALNESETKEPILEDKYIINGKDFIETCDIYTIDTRDTGHCAVMETNTYNLWASWANNKIIINTKEKVDITGYGKLYINMDMMTNATTIPSEVIIGLCNEKENTTNFLISKSISVNAKQWTNAAMMLDLSKLEKKEDNSYYIKVILKHNEKNGYTVNANINFLKLIQNAESQEVEYNAETFEWEKTNTSTASVVELKDGKYALHASYANTSTYINSKEKIDLTNVNIITLDANIGTDYYGTINTTLYLVACNSKNDTIENSVKRASTLYTGNSLINTKIFLDVTDLKGEYYLKVILNHGPTPSAYTSSAYINSLKYEM